ncbi:unnamed protein product [Mycena citricolor]|uniref:Uncharacterized protein n=1 Tax=Mycena citricolor TaxID=2018698 RepID=A0AAD2HIE5_9AGAR|nr:unnamed protein product [Mycena citricolor]
MRSMHVHGQKAVVRQRQMWRDRLFRPIASMRIGVSADDNESRTRSCLRTRMRTVKTFDSSTRMNLCFLSCSTSYVFHAAVVAQPSRHLGALEVESIHPELGRRRSAW